LKQEWESHGFYGRGENAWKYMWEVDKEDGKYKEAKAWKKEFLKEGFFKMIGPRIMRVGEAYIYPWLVTRWVLEEGAEGLSRLLINYYGGVESPESWGPHVFYPGDLQKRVFGKVKVCSRALKRARSQVAKTEAELVKQRLERVINDALL
jgi:hypothetical protein